MNHVDHSDAINRIADFFEDDNSGIDLVKGEVALSIKDLAEFDPTVADYLLDHGNEVQKIIEDAVSKLFPDELSLRVTIKHVPKIAERKINRIRVEDEGKLLSISGLLQTRTNVYPEIIKTDWECSRCGLEVTMPGVTPPEACIKCKKKMQVVQQYKRDSLSVKLEEMPERLVGSEQASEIYVRFFGHLCKHDFNLALGNRIQVSGFLKAISATKKPNVCCRWQLVALGYTNLDSIAFDTKTTPEEEALFEAIKKSSNPAKFISDLIFKDIYGYLKAKECIVLQQFGGLMVGRDRDYIHILLLGPPGVCKTDLAVRGAEINPVHKMGAGPSTSDVGLTASVKKDELSGNWSIVAGLLPKANSGVVMYDEIEKASDNEKKALHVPMESGKIPVNKATISSTLTANTAILATANPKADEDLPKVAGNIDLPSSILDRFDFIFVFEDEIDRQKDAAICQLLINRATNTLSSTRNVPHLTSFEWNGTTFYSSTIAKYVYRSKKIQISLSRRVEKMVSTWYTQLRQISKQAGFEQKRPTPRLIQSIIRVARATTRSKMKDTVTQKEIKQAIEYFCFMYNSDNLLPPEICTVG